MAKSKSKISLSDVPPGMTLVKSHTYGDHIRAKRGTYKKAKLNAALKEGAARIGEANAAAKLFKDAIDRHRRGLINRSLWPDLVSMFRRQQTKLGKIDFTQLKSFEFHKRYTLHKLISAEVVTTYDDKNRLFRAVVSYGGFVFNKSIIDGYKLTAIVMFPDIRKKTAKTVSEESAILPMKEEHLPFEVSVAVPPGAKCFVFCLRIDGCSKGKVYHTIATKGMAVISTGAIGRKGTSRQG